MNETRRVLIKYAQFCLVGGSGVLVDMGVLWLLASPATLGWNITASKLVAAEVALLSNFVWNDLWTFRALARAGVRARLWRLLKFNLICLAGIGLSVGLLNFQVHRLGMNLYVANLVAIVAASVWNFGLNLRFGWSGDGSGKRESECLAVSVDGPHSSVRPERTCRGATNR